ncbi:MAG: hypothetical protein ACAH24_14560 [Hyphomicrobiaceae bacterium]
MDAGRREGIFSSMTKTQIKAILDRVRTWPEDRQADLARIALHIEAQEARLAPEDEETKAAIAEGLAQAKQRKFASDARVKATWRKFGL